MVTHEACRTRQGEDRMVDGYTVSATGKKATFDEGIKNATLSVVHPVVITMAKQPGDIDFTGFLPSEMSHFSLIFVLHVVIVMGKDLILGKFS